MTLDLATLDPGALAGLSDDQFQTSMAEVIRLQAEDRQQNQILYYRAASAEAEKLHFSKAHLIGLGGGNRSSKTESCLVETVACATGVFPRHYEDEFRAKFLGPINVRICIESLTTVLHPIMLPKLKWWVWSGISERGGDLGHWGWVPKDCLIGGEWEKSWSEKLRVLRVLCLDPDDPEHVLGESTIQFMSYDQDPTDYASGTFHICHMDEPPPAAIWRENQARVLDVNGRLFLSMTWPDDASIGVDWIYDEVYEPGTSGPMKDPDIDWFELQTLDNRFIDKDVILARTASWSEQERQVRLKGQPLRFSNRIHPLFTDATATWCFTCGKNCLPVDDHCPCERRSIDLGEYVHVQEFELGDNWPVIYLIDPHPRKPHMMCWVAVDPADDLYVVEEKQIDGDAADVKALVDDTEEALGLDTRLRQMDPNMGASVSGARREVTWQDEFADAGLVLELADDSDVGRKRVNQYLKPDPHTRRPRLTFHPRCTVAIQSMKRHVWDDFRRSADRDLKQQPKDKYSDFPAMLKYLLNGDPNFRMLYAGAPVLTRGGTRRGVY